VSFINSERGDNKVRVTDNIFSFCRINWQGTTSEPIDDQIFVNLIQRNKVSLYRLAKGIVKNEHEIEEAISETILKSYVNLNQLKSLDSFKPWIMRILANECYTILRKKKRIDLQENMEAFNLVCEDTNEHELMWAINKLDEGFRTILILFYYEDMSIKDISKILNISQGTVKSRLNRAKAKLKNILEDNSGSDINGLHR
jgi:RNA polymerase sigma-70 factor, ECF subfamily